MIVLGLTGSIGMGKSTTLAMFAERGAAVWDADTAVHALYAAGGGGVDAVEQAFPGVTREGAIDRARLSARVVGDEAAMKRLEAIVHPLVARHRANFLHRAEEAGTALTILDIPLLFEAGGEASVDAVIVVTASPDIQRRRVLARPGMDAAKFEALLARQLPDADKRVRGDFTIDTGEGMDAARSQVDRVLATVLDPAWRPAAMSRVARLDDGREAPH